MTIKITFGVRGEYSPLMGFLGVTSSGQSSPSSIVSINSVVASVSIGNTFGVNIENTYVSSNQSSTSYDLYNVDYREFRDSNNNEFISPEAVTDYINSSIQIATDNIALRYTRLPSVIGITTVTQNTPFEYQIQDPGVLSIFWKKLSIPLGIEVSQFDNRTISGILTSVGDYYLEYEKANATGLTTSTLHISVV